MTKREQLFFFAGVALMALAVMLPSCGRAQADSPYAHYFAAPDGARCYVIYANGQPTGGNCVP